MDIKEFGEYMRSLRLKRGLGVNQLGKLSSVSGAQISRLENAERGLPKPETLKKLSTVLKVPYDDLMKKAGYIDGEETQSTKNDLTSKDERDIAKKLENILESMETDTALAFDGEPMDEATKELVKTAIESNLRLTKQLAKKKFTPKKYRKDGE